MSLEGGVDPPFQILSAYSIYGALSHQRTVNLVRYLGHWVTFTFYGSTDDRRPLNRPVGRDAEADTDPADGTELRRGHRRPKSSKGGRPPFPDLNTAADERKALA